MVLLRLRLRLDDEPGRFAPIAARIAAERGNILSFGVLYDAKGGVVDDLVVQVPDDFDPDQLHGSLEAAGCSEVSHGVVDARALRDRSTHMLELASRLVERPETLRALLTELLVADEVTVYGVGAPMAAPRDRSVITLALPDGRTVRVQRRWPTFTFTEELRGRVLLRLADSLLRTMADCPGWSAVLPDDESGRPAEGAGAVATSTAATAGALGRRVGLPHLPTFDPGLMHTLLLRAVKAEPYLSASARLTRGVLAPQIAMVRLMVDIARLPARLTGLPRGGGRRSSLVIVDGEVRDLHGGDEAGSTAGQAPGPPLPQVG